MAPREHGRSGSVSPVLPHGNSGLEVDWPFSVTQHTPICHSPHHSPLSLGHGNNSNHCLVLAFMCTNLGLKDQSLLPLSHAELHETTDISQNAVCHCFVGMPFTLCCKAMFILQVPVQMSSPPGGPPCLRLQKALFMFLLFVLLLTCDAEMICLPSCLPREEAPLSYSLLLPLT